MLQGPFRVPSFNGYVPRRLQPWIYLLFAFVFLMSGGIYGGAMSQVMGEYSLMREDVLMIVMFNVVDDAALCQSCRHGHLLPHALPHEVPLYQPQASAECSFDGGSVQLPHHVYRLGAGDVCLGLYCRILQTVWLF